MHDAAPKALRTPGVQKRMKIVYNGTSAWITQTRIAVQTIHLKGHVNIPAVISNRANPPEIEMQVQSALSRQVLPKPACKTLSLCFHDPRESHTPCDTLPPRCPLHTVWLDVVT